MKGYIEHLQSQIEYWKMISLVEKEKNMKLEEILKKLEKTIYVLEDKENK